VRYDIFGEGVLITRKMEQYGKPGSVCISEDTKKYLQLQPDIAMEYQIDYVKTVYIPNIDKHVKQFSIEYKVAESIESYMFDSNSKASQEGSRAAVSDDESKEHIELSSNAGSAKARDQREDLRKPKKANQKKRVELEEEESEQGSLQMKKLKGGKQGNNSE